MTSNLIIAGVLLAIIFAWRLMPPETAKAVMGYMSVVTRAAATPDTATARRWRDRMGKVVVWVGFLAVLLVLQDKLPFWNWWWENQDVFWVSQVVILAILLTWDIGPWPRLIGILLGVLVLALVVMAVYWGVSAIVSAITSPVSTTSPVAIITASKTVTVKRVVAHPAEWTKKESVPPLHLFSLDFDGEIMIQGLNGKPFKAKPGEPVWLGIDESNFAFSFMSLEKSPVEVTISTWPK